MKVDIEADSKALEAAIEQQIVKIPSRLAEKMEDVCLLVEADAKKNCPAVDGTLRQSITHALEEDDGMITGYVGSNLEYAPYVHQGTGIFAIEGNGRKQVPWTYYDAKKGEYVSTSGIEPNPFITEAIQANMDEILRHLGRFMKDD